jgi:adenine deaminase
VPPSRSAGRDVPAVALAEDRRLVRVALGKEPPDLLVKNGRLLNVHSGEVLEGASLAVVADRIAWVGWEAPAAGTVSAGPGAAGPRAAGRGTKVVDAEGAYLSPGFVDMHGHADFLANPVALAESILPLGTTAMLSDTHDTVGALGPMGLDLLLSSTRDLPFHYFFTFPATCPPLPAIEGDDLFPLPEILSRLGDVRILAFSEITAWTRLLDGDLELMEKVAVAREAGLRLEGHTAGCSPDKLSALVALGISSCHESISPGDVLMRLRMGLATALRHGSIRADLEVLAPVVVDHPELDTARLMLTPDWMSPQDVVRLGYIDNLLGRAIELGIPPMTAYQMVTINPATYLRLDHRLGGIAPGRQADILLIDDLKVPRPRVVIVGGREVARDGRMLQAFPPFPAVPIEHWPRHRVPQGPLEASCFRLVREDATGGVRDVDLPAIHMENKTITRTMRVAARLEHGFLSPASGRSLAGARKGEEVELLHLSLWSGMQQRWLNVALSGFGAAVGGLAASVVHETHAPLVLGADPRDMALAARRMLEIGGGIVLVEQGGIVHELPLAAGGLLHTGPLSEVASSMEALNEYLRARGCPWDDPFFGMNFLTFTGLPFVRLTPSGLFESKRGVTSAL